jgi:hypothetical protein
MKFFVCIGAFLCVAACEYSSGFSEGTTPKWPSTSVGAKKLKGAPVQGATAPGNLQGPPAAAPGVKPGAKPGAKPGFGPGSKA